jgi:hypothetical protein
MNYNGNEWGSVLRVSCSLSWVPFLSMLQNAKFVQDKNITSVSSRATPESPSNDTN